MSKPAKHTGVTSGEPIDSYLPSAGNRGYRVSRYELDLEYNVASNRLAGRATVTATTVEPLARLSFDLSPALTVAKVTVNGARAPKFAHRGGKLTITMPKPVPTGTALVVTVRYAGAPVPVHGPWGEVGWEELAEGVLVASQPNGASSWFPCDDHPSSKASYRIELTCDSPYFAVANGILTGRRVRAAQTTWTYEQSEPMAAYLATIQIGEYERVAVPDSRVPGSVGPGAGVPMSAVLPPRLRKHFDRDFARQPQMMEVFTDLFGPYPFPAYTVVVTADELEIPIEAQGISVFGANHCDGHGREERLVAHELAHQWFGNSLTLRRWRDIWLHEGFACYAEWLWSERSGGPATHQLAAAAHAGLARLPQDLLPADPGPELMFDDRLYKRGALVLHALRQGIGDRPFFDLLREWTRKFRHATVTTEDFTDLAAHYAHQPLHPLWDAWLLSPALPPLP
ncbi:M1 family metallopeptidase [Rhodococcus sp. D2-41]|uniref:Aminopeptidase N n=1 Tax=Speluncibacter jeojiensis TaxID=2710754 RepID=A0A9X4RJ81_9ACTN|nr:M1 family metallopeptidase [Rhodococcus sp. D2-41]MDG3009332.1 M1 family metallopeptidase [Rhodococcus sp. D2-41]MDG3016881.1 M1 family metallopeptidase [Corynebacteriales bacterium D3-21]